MSDIKALAEDIARGSAQDIERSHKAAFYAELRKFREGDAAAGRHLETCALRAPLARDQYQLFVMYFRDQADEFKIRRRLAIPSLTPMSVATFERWCDEVAEAIGKELEKSK